MSGQSSRWMRWGVRVALLGAIGGTAFALFKSTQVDPRIDNQNYDVLYEKPENWNVLPVSMMAEFLYQSPERNAFIRGSFQQTYSSINPTPDQTARSLAEYYVATTRENLDGWTAEIYDEVEGADTNWVIARRRRSDRTLYNAFASKGNTTLVVTLYGTGEDADSVKQYLPMFKQFLSEIRLVTQPPRYVDNR
ncbi:MAG: hypothetical protein SNJ74_10015 [Fimbriimonadaceae bacterium]